MRKFIKNIQVMWRRSIASFGQLIRYFKLSLGVFNHNDDRDSGFGSSLVTEKDRPKKLISNPEFLNQCQKVNEKEKCQQLISSSLLLKNNPFISLVQENVDILKKYEQLSLRMDEGSEARLLAEQMVTEIRDALERSGVDRIVNDVLYDALRHETNTAVLISNGTRISKTLETGLCLGTRVFKKAKVEIVTQ